METIAFADAPQWEEWLARHHETETEIWLKIAKKHSGIPSVTNDEALDVALCYGWINSLRKPLDESYYLQRYSRRRPKSSWSMVNVDNVEALMAAGRMRAPGLAEVEAAKADGRWDAAYASPKNATIPPELARALADNEKARAAFDSMTKTDRYLAILPLLKARTAEGRAACVRRTIAALETRRSP